MATAGSPTSIAINHKTHMIYVSYYESNGNGEVFVIDGRNNTVVAKIPVGKVPRGLAVDQNTNMVYHK
jgi:YVTN family beta-propeller protein